MRTAYVEEVDEKELISSAINGMLSHLDPHSSYLPPDDFDDMRVQTKGEFGGLGIEVTQEQGFVKVVAPIEGTPADRAGIEPGDFITHVDGDSVLGLTLNEAVDLMRGPGRLGDHHHPHPRGHRGAVRRHDHPRHHHHRGGALAARGRTWWCSGSPPSTSRPSRTCEKQLAEQVEAAGGMDEGDAASSSTCATTRAGS